MKPILYFKETVTEDAVISVPIFVKGFTKIGSFNITIHYDPAIMIIVNPPGGLNSKQGSLGCNNKTPGIIKFGWFTWPGVSLPDESILLELEFQKVKEGTSPLTFASDFGLSNDSWTELETEYINSTLTFKNKEIMATNLKFVYGDTIDIQLKTGNKFHVPIKTTADLIVSAISLIMNYPDEYLKVTRVGIPDYPTGDILTDNFGFNDKSRPERVTIGWFCANPESRLTPKTGETLLIVEFEVEKDFAENQELVFTVSEDIENELAGVDVKNPPSLPIEHPNYYYTPIPNVILMVDKYRNILTLPAPPEPVFPPNSRVAERKDIMNYKGKQVISKKCSNCQNYKDRKCQLGNYIVAKGGICDYYL
jgi:hypothetical protein